jgi:hypothetical protein
MSRRSLSLSLEPLPAKTSIISSREVGVLYSVPHSPEKIARTTRPPGKFPGLNLQLACCGLVLIAMCVVGGLGTRTQPDLGPSNPPSKPVATSASTQLNLSSEVPEVLGSKVETKLSENETKEEKAAQSRPPFVRTHGELIPRAAFADL